MMCRCDTSSLVDVICESKIENVIFIQARWSFYEIFKM